MEEDGKQRANVESLFSHQQKDQIWLFAQRMSLHSGKNSPDALHLLPSTILPLTDLTLTLHVAYVCICRRFSHTDALFFSFWFSYIQSLACYCE